MSQIGAIFLVFLCLFSLGCQRTKGKPFSPNQGPNLLVSNEVKPELTEQSIDSVVALDAKQIDGLKALKLDLLNQKIITLSETLFRSSKLDDPEFQTSTSGRNSLANLNAYISEGLSRPTFDKSVLADYYKALKYLCSERDMTCPRTKYFAQDSYTSRIIWELTKAEKNLQKKYDYLKVGFSLAGRKSPDKFLVGEWFSNIVTYLSEFLDQNALAKGALVVRTDRSKAELKKIIEISNLLAASQDSKYVSKFLSPQILTILKWSSTGQMASILGYSFSEELNKLIAANFNNSDIAQAVKSELNKIEKDETSYTAMLNRVKSLYPNTLEQFQVKTYSYGSLNDKELVYFLMLAKVLKGARTADILPYWKASDRNFERLFSMIENFVRLDMIENAQRSGVEFGNKVKELTRKGTPPAEFFRTMLSFGNSTPAAHWMAFHGRVQSLKNVYEILVNSGEAKANLNSHEIIQKTGSFFDHLNLSIKIMVTLPNEIMLAYLASKSNFQQTLIVSRMKVDFNASVLLRYVINAQMPIFYTFTGLGPDGDGQRINAYQMMWAFSYLMKFDLLERYGVSLADFQREFFSKLIDIDRKKMDSSLKELNARFSAGGSGTKFLNECSRLNAKQEIRVQYNDLSDILYANFWGRPGFNHPKEGSFKETTNFFLTADTSHNSVEETIETMRTELLPKIRILKNFLWITKHIHKVKYSNDLKEVENLYLNAKDLVDRNYQKIQSIFDTVRECVQTAQETEEQRTFEILEMEKSFGRDVRIALKVLRAIGIKSTTAKLSTLTGPEVKTLLTHPHFISIDKNLPLLPALNKWHLDLAFNKLAQSEVEGLRNNQEASIGFNFDNAGNPQLKVRVVDLYLRVAKLLETQYFEKSFSAKNIKTRLVLGSNLESLFSLDAGTIKLEGNSPGTLNSPVFYRESSEKSEIAYDDGMIRNFNQFFYWLNIKSGANRFIVSMIKSEMSLIKLRSAVGYDLDDLGNLAKKDPKTQSNVTQYLRRSVALLLRDFTYFQLKPRDEAVLRAISGTGYWSINGDVRNTYFKAAEGPGRLFIESEITGEPAGITDEYFNFLVSYRLGYMPMTRSYRPISEEFWFPPAVDRATVADSELVGRRNAFEEARIFSNSMAQRETSLVLPLTKDLLDSTDTLFRYPVEQDLRIVSDFFDVILIERAKPNLPKARYDLNKNSVESVLLSEAMVRKYTDDIKRFNGETKSLLFPSDLKKRALWQ